MVVKIRTNKSYEDCRDLQLIVAAYHLIIEDLFLETNYKTVSNTNTYSRRALLNSHDIDELIIDREGAVPI